MVYWNGLPVVLVLDEDHANGTKPIEVFVPWETIEEGGSGLLKIRCRVHDEVLNYSGELQQWSKLITVQGNFDLNLLNAPYFVVDEEDADEVNYDTQAAGPFKFTVIVPEKLPDGTKLPTSVWVVATLKGTRFDGTQVKETQVAVLSRTGRAAGIPVSSEIVKKHIGGLLQCFYELRSGSATGTTLGKSSLASVGVYGTVSNMPPVSIEEAKVGLISLKNLLAITVTFPIFTPLELSYDVTLRMQGRHSDGSLEIFEETLLAGAAPPPPRKIRLEDLKRFEGIPNVKIVYRVDDGKDSDDQTFRESEPLFVTFGDAVAELPKPQIKEVDASGNLDPASVYGSVTVTLLLATAAIGAKVFWYWIGSGKGGITGNSQSPIIVNGNTAGKSVKFQVDEKYVNANDTIRLSYVVVSADGSTVSRSPVLEVSVGMALGDLRRAEVLQATTMPDELSPAQTVDGAIVRVTIPRSAAGDKVRMEWKGLAGIGCYTETKDGTGSNIIDFTVPPEVIGANLLPGGRDITVQYFVIRAGKETPSPILKLRLLAIKPIPVPTIENIGDRAVLDINQLLGNERIFISRWRYIHREQRFDLECRGVNKDGTPYHQKLDNASLVTATGEAHGLSPAAPVGPMRNLKHDSIFEILCRVYYDRSTIKENAIEFTLRRYLIQAEPAVNLMFLDAPYAVGPNGRLDTVRLDAGSNVTAAVKVSVTLENGFSFADGTMGTKEFTTDARGKLAITGIRCPGEVGVYSILANTAKSSANADIDVKRLLQAGSIISLRGNPYGIAITPDNLYAYVTLGDAGVVAKVDLAVGKVIKEIDIGSTVMYVACSPDGRKVYLPTSGFVVIIDANEDRISNRIVVPGALYHYTLSFSRDGRYAFVTTVTITGGVYTSGLVRLDAKSETIDKIYTLGSGTSSNRAHCNLDDKSVYSTDVYGKVYQTDLASGLTSVIFQAPTLFAYSVGARILKSRDLKSIYISTLSSPVLASSTSSSIVKIDALTLQRSVLSLPLFAASPMAINATETLMVVWGYGASALINLTTGVIIKYMPSVTEAGAVFSPSGQYVYVCDIGAPRLVVNSVI